MHSCSTPECSGCIYQQGGEPIFCIPLFRCRQLGTVGYKVWKHHLKSSSLRSILDNAILRWKVTHLSSYDWLGLMFLSFENGSLGGNAPKENAIHMQRKKKLYRVVEWGHSLLAIRKLKMTNQRMKDVPMVIRYGSGSRRLSNNDMWLSM